MSDSITENKKKTCSFPAISLRAYRVQLVDGLKQLETSGQGKSWQVGGVLRNITAIDKLRHTHWELGGCLCWHTDAELAEEARRENYRNDWIPFRRQMAEDANGGK
jgi:hypothetical protein